MKVTPMLGENIVNYPEHILDGKLWRMSEKIDGVRRIFYKDKHGVVTAWSRTSHQDIWIPHICEFFEAPWFPYDTFYDTELVDRESYYNHITSYELRRITNSKASQQYQDNKQDLMAICFDIFQIGSMKKAFERDVELYSLFGRGRPEDAVIRVPIFGNVFGADMETIRKTMDMVTARGGEGLMLLNLDSIYFGGRTRDLIKVKRLKEFVGKVIDFEMARPGTKIKGMVAAVIVDVPGCTIPVRVGSGFNNEERLAMVADSPVGKYIDIEAFDYSKNRTGGISLNIPIFKQFISAEKAAPIMKENKIIGGMKNGKRICR